MAQVRKTQKTEVSVEEFLDSIADPVRKADATTMVQLLREVTGAEARMWGPAIIGFGDGSYVSANGKSNDWFRLGFSPRKASTTLYGMGNFQGDELTRLGKHELSGGCLHLKRLADIDLNVLRKIVERLWA